MKRDSVDEKCKGGIRGGGGLRTWLGMKDPRIVRASRVLGGKDRHSKVNTIKGLRDRRVRLSVQTAIQLYELQDQLGLSQPSKVVDWLISVTQNEIDKLPPLPMPVSGVFPAIEEQSITQLPSQQQQNHQVLLPVATKWKQQPEDGVDVVREQFIQDHHHQFIRRPGLGLLQTINPSLFSISTAAGNTTAGVSPVGRTSSSANSILQPWTGFLQPFMPVGSQLFQPYMGNYIDLGESIAPTPNTTTTTSSLQSPAISSPSSSPFTLFYPSATPSMLPFPNEHLLKALCLPKPPSSQ